MNQEKWETIKGMVKEKFEIEDEGTAALEDGPGEREYVVFNGPLGKMKLEGIIKPAVIDKKVIANKRIGANSVEQNVYSETDKVFMFNPYRWSEELNDWQQIDAEDFELE